MSCQELAAIAHWTPRQDCRQDCVACRVLLVRIDVRSCLGAEAPSQDARRKPQVDSYLASPGLQSGEERRNRRKTRIGFLPPGTEIPGSPSARIAFVLARERKLSVADGRAVLRRLKSAARRLRESRLFLRRCGSTLLKTQDPRPLCGGSPGNYTVRVYAKTNCYPLRPAVPPARSPAARLPRNGPGDESAGWPPVVPAREPTSPPCG